MKAKRAVCQAELRPHAFVSGISALIEQETTTHQEVTTTLLTVRADKTA